MQYNIWHILKPYALEVDIPPEKLNLRKDRISRETAEQALVDAVITLAAVTPLAEITVHLLAETAKVNFGYVNRYFESRLNLFAIATDELADRGIAFLKGTSLQRPVVQRNVSNDLSDDDLQMTRENVLPIGITRLKIVQFLIASGLPPERFVKKSQEVLATAVELTTQAGMDPVVARARVVHGIAMMWSAATLSPVLGLTSQELSDSYAIFFANIRQPDN